MKKKNEIFRTSLILAGLIGSAGLLYIGFAPVPGQNLNSQLQQGPLQLDVPVIQQSIGNLLRGNGARDGIQ